MSRKSRLALAGGLLAVLVAVALALGLTRGGDDGTSAPGTGTRAASATAVPGATGDAQALVSVPPGMAAVTADQLPAEARRTLRLIDAGGPYPYRQDGAVFANREGRLPKQKSGYYHEYTVETPGSPDRGARRVITGRPGERYYTADHYATFRVIVP
ncbi:ribonuclease domain-containing protein [Yinghuangia seranimata]|nr:ribonuclease domain-containing protein [Yinghuangia seranimata]MDI2126150.1 ribonuclease domain-containing protein [Yinghuangia seranimata]